MIKSKDYYKKNFYKITGITSTILGLSVGHICGSVDNVIGDTLLFILILVLLMYQILDFVNMKRSYKRDLVDVFCRVIEKELGFK